MTTVCKILFVWTILAAVAGAAFACRLFRIVERDDDSSRAP